MIKHNRTTKAIAGLAFVTSAVVAVPGLASASAPASSFQHAQQQLEQQLASRVTQIARLSTDVTNSKALTPAHVTQLSTNLAADTSNINALVIKVPTDTTRAQVNADRSAMLKANRVFAVATPQVFETIQADSVAAQVATLQGDESELQAGVNSLVGQHGYNNAFNHYVAFVKAVNAASSDVNSVGSSVLAQTPADYPGDTHVFVRANRLLLNAAISLAHASYDASVVGLASGGYVGS